MTRYLRQRQRRATPPRLTIALATAVALVATATPVGAFAAPLAPAVVEDIGEDGGGVKVTRAEDAQALVAEAAEPKTYVVQMASAPVVAYDGGVKGLKATKPHGGSKVDPADPAVEAYSKHLKGKQRAALAKVEGGGPSYSYVYSFNGFAAELTPAQAAELQAQPDVVAVHPDQLVETDTSSTPSFLGLDGEGGLWDRLGGPTGGKKTPGAGEDIVIGVIDSGIWPEVGSFSDRSTSNKLVYQGKPEGFRGTCASAENVGDDSWDTNLCNNKLVTAQYFNAAWGGNEGVAQQLPWEFLSPRDYNGHGTHTASTAGGNHGVDVTGPAAMFGEISGIAPRARIASYKALWSVEDGTTANGYTSDMVAAIDRAVADGVDVINYSVSGSSTDFLEPTEAAFLNAAAAGIFVSASAGNSGPDAATVAHPGPWLTTVAAGTHDRTTTGAVVLGNGARYAGVSVSDRAVGPAPLISGGAARAAGASMGAGARCYPASANNGKPALDPAKVTGKIVLCERGGDIARVDSSRAVAEAGGVGMIFVNAFENSLNADFHSVPTVHLPDSESGAISAYAASAGATATIEKAVIANGGKAPFTAAFSSRGPLVAGNGDVLKPDVIAPGQDILAAVAPPGQGGMDFNLMSGTSMSAPHVAGLAALLRDLHPEWSPMAIKSAMMTTGSDVLDGESASDPNLIFKQGAGHVQPTSAADPGLVYESGADDWLAFLCGSTRGVPDDTCDGLESDGRSLDPSDLNTPSIGIGLLDGTQTVTRTVTNVDDQSSTYTAAVSGLTGVGVTVEPSTLTVAPGQTASYAVTFTVGEETELFDYLAGQLSWSDGSHTVRSPIVLRAKQPGEEDWAARYDGAGGQFGSSTDVGSEVIVHPDGQRVYMSGFSRPPSAGGLVSDFLTAAYDPETGETLWEEQWDASNGGSDEPAGFGISPDGDTVYVAGTSGGGYLTVAYDGATGEKRWSTRVNGPGPAGDFVNDLAVSPDGSSVFVTGYQSMGEAQLDYATVAYDAVTGEQRWVARYDDPVSGTDDARGIAVSDDGSTVVITGQSQGEDTGLTDWGTVAYDAATGEQLWEVLRNGSEGQIDIAENIAVAGDTVIVAGVVSNTDRQVDWETVAYDLTTGEERWAIGYGEALTDVPQSLALTPDGGAVVVAGNVEGGADMDYATVAYDVADGEQLWAARYDGTAHGSDVAYDVALTEDGTRAVVTGESRSAETAWDYVTIAYDMSTGEQIWSGSYDATGASDGANGVAVDQRADGSRRVFVTGASTTAYDSVGLDSNVDAATVAYFDPFE
ncbi:S8 family serine peptidase [Microbacterium sp. CFBP9034]|uniref:S8 family serine peptidase n=1 Tax=Microbacterium sp. CFBP9034 TaxID=3096540 RepID=UPI002A6AAF9C|nr:S8 family serine peptidase [Microbacterium sp. CFBP9034]MDY0908543.1 S8 family serine peptidase [Microbacterium sp. CFBP9034]